ncbi:MAG: hypothetical protein RQ847_00245 [Wenzhouxiangellaceae bacterium]|nr:hypothetical protein [Wenzhouxiangellaceae bacterium]
MAPPIRGPIGIVAALDREAVALRRTATDAGAVLLEVPGPGLAAAEAGARRLVERGARSLISWGTAGALGAARAGDIVIAEAVLGPRERRIATDRELTSDLRERLAGVAPLHAGLLVSVDAPVATVAEKVRLGRDTGALAVDMESAGVAAAAVETGLPFAVLRVVVDEAGRAVPPAAVAALNGPRVDLLALLGTLVKYPHRLGPQIYGLWALGRAASKADRTLHECARRIVFPAGTSTGGARLP